MLRARPSAGALLDVRRRPGERGTDGATECKKEREQKNGCTVHIYHGAPVCTGYFRSGNRYLRYHTRDIGVFVFLDSNGFNLGERERGRAQSTEEKSHTFVETCLSRNNDVATLFILLGLTNFSDISARFRIFPDCSRLFRLLQ